MVWRTLCSLPPVLPLFLLVVIQFHLVPSFSSPYSYTLVPLNASQSVPPSLEPPAGGQFDQILDLSNFFHVFPYQSCYPDITLPFPFPLFSSMYFFLGITFHWYPAIP